ncbi:MAG: glycerophosphodiester phosphodiesterase family protein [Armatimonadota bacterium]|jgi:glycerophosphoryl diester phosphodiesterase
MDKICSIGHRGIAAEAPENTLASFARAIELSPDMIECDVRHTKDDNLIIMHDPTVDRTTDGSGCVAKMTLEEIKTLDAGSWRSPQYAGERVPTLDETLALCKGRVRLILELKEEEIDSGVVQAVRNFGMEDGVVIASFYDKVGLRLPNLSTRLVFKRLVWRYLPLTESESVQLVDESAALNASILGINYQAVSGALVRASHAAGIKIMPWTVDDRENMVSMAELGVDGITSNNLRLLLEVLKDIGAES